MAKKQKPPVVVAELGRPETPSETAARKAHDSRMYRQRKTVNNLVFSLLVSMGMVLVIFLLTQPGEDVFKDRSVDVAELAESAAPSAARPLAAPQVPAEWKAKQAELRGSGGVSSWHVNYTTVDAATGTEAYAAVVQAFTADGAPVDETWIAQQLEGQVPTGDEQIEGIHWIVYEHGDRDREQSNVLFALQGEWQGDTILVYGTDTPANLRVLAASVAKSLETAQPLPTAEEPAESSPEPSKES